MNALAPAPRRRRFPPVSGALGDLLAEQVLVPALQDPATQRELEAALVGVLESPAARSAVRPMLIEAGVWVGGGVLGALLLYRLLR